MGRVTAKFAATFFVLKTLYVILIKAILQNTANFISLPKEIQPN